MSDDRRLQAPARAAIERDDASAHVSAASAWESAIKAALGKLNPRDLDVPAEIEAGGFLEPPIRARHAQEGQTLVTYDPAIDAHDAPSL